MITSAAQPEKNFLKTAGTVLEKFNSFSVLFLFIVGACALVFISGFPEPHVDDLFYTGIAINIANKGKLVDTLVTYLAEAGLQVDHFLQYPPFYFYVLGGWLRLFRVSANSLLLFQTTCYIIFCTFGSLILSFYRFPRAVSYYLCVVYLAGVITIGLRPDALGMAFLASGLWLLTREGWLNYFGGFGLLCAAVLSWPTVVAYAFSLGIAIPLTHLARDRTKINAQYLIKLVSSAFAAVLVNVGLFLIAINFDLSNFFHDFFATSASRRTPLLQAFPFFFQNITKLADKFLTLPIYVFCVLVIIGTLIFALRKPVQAERTILFLAINAGILLGIFSYASIVWLPTFFCWVEIILIISSLKPGKLGLTLSLIALAIFTLNQSPTLAFFVKHEPASIEQINQVKQYVSDNPTKKYAIDGVVGRYVFDFNLPANTIQWEESAGLPKVYPTSFADKATDTVWLVSNMRFSTLYPLVQSPYERIKIFGYTFNTQLKRPYDMEIIP